MNHCYYLSIIEGSGNITHRMNSFGRITWYRPKVDLILGYECYNYDPRVGN